MRQGRDRFIDVVRGPSGCCQSGPRETGMETEVVVQGGEDGSAGGSGCRGREQLVPWMFKR